MERNQILGLVSASNALTTNQMHPIMWKTAYVKHPPKRAFMHYVLLDILVRPKAKGTFWIFFLKHQFCFCFLHYSSSTYAGWYLKWVIWKKINYEILVILLPIVIKSTFTFSALSIHYSMSGDYFSSSMFLITAATGMMNSKCFPIDYQDTGTISKSSQALIHIIQFRAEKGQHELVTAFLVQCFLLFQFLHSLTC